MEPPPTSTRSTGQSTLSTSASMTAEEGVIIIGGAESAAAFRPLKYIWDCSMVERCIVDECKKAWLCKWCNKTFIPEHGTRALKHVLKIKDGGIGTCSAIVNEPFLSRYQELYQKKDNTSAARKRSAIDVESTIASRQETATEQLMAKRGNDRLPNLPPFYIPSSSFLPESNATIKKFTGSTSTTRFYSSQPSISSALQNTVDIRKSNNASVEMAIADFFHCETIADSVVESPRFAQLLKLARTVGSNFKIPSRKKISGELLDLNYNAVYNENKTLLCSEASTFGLSFIGDGATIKRMPLLNILGLCGTTPPMTIAIVDCTNHMQEGGKKDASYIASLFEEKVGEYDPGNVNTDVFFFDGASNVQKAGEVLMAKFPILSASMGESMLYPFFSLLLPE